MDKTKEKDIALIEEITARITAFLKSEIVCFTEKRENGFAVCLPGGKKFLVSIQKEGKDRELKTCSKIIL